MPAPAAAPARAEIAARQAPRTQSSPPAQQAVWTGVERIVAVGDVHGDFEQFVSVLESAGLVDGQGNWTGGKTHLVQTGDVVDRGPDSRRIMDLLMKLEQQAASAGGRVHALTGNHEAMDVYGDLRYVSPGELASYRELNTHDVSYIENRSALTADAKPELDRTRWKSDSVPGFAEHRAAFSPEGKYGKWIRGHNAMIKIDDTLLAHAGLGPKYASWSLDQINNEVRDELNHFEKLHGGIVTDEEGPLWYRDLAKADEAGLQPFVSALLSHFGAKRIVIGHTYTNAAITPRFQGQAILVDIGLSRVYDNVSKIACLVIENGKAYALHRGQGLALPNDDDADMLRYLKQAAALDPKPSPLEPRIAALETRLASASK